MAPETPKGVSSRLLTMKFMQRAIASNSTTASPESETHSAKKRKFEHDSPSGRLSMDFDQASVDAAMQAQEAKRRSALEQHATGDTHWVLNTKFEKPASAKTKAARKIVYVGYGDIDSENDSGDGEDVAANGRTTTHKPKPKAEQSQTPSDDESADDSADDSDESEDSNPRKRKQPGSQQESRSRSKSRTRPTAADLKSKELRDKRRKKEVRLNNITSISGAGDNSPSNKSMTCYNCHQPGHRANDCPKRKSGGRGR